MIRSNHLTELADQVRDAIVASDAAHLTATAKALEAGNLLIAAKEECQHGDWLPFLERAGLGERQAQRLMQLARSGLKSDTVSHLGGIKAALNWLANWALPAGDEVIYVSLDHRVDASDGWVACILPSEITGHYNVTVIGPQGATYTTTGKPVAADAIRLGDGTYFNGLWATLEKVLPIPIADWHFTTGSIYSLIDDCEFLNSLIEAPDDPGKAPLPYSYDAMIRAMEKCVSDFTSDTYLSTRQAMATCLLLMDKWPRDPRMMQTLARIANNDSCRLLAAQIDQLADERLAAKRRRVFDLQNRGATW